MSNTTLCVCVGPADHTVTAPLLASPRHLGNILNLRWGALVSHASVRCEVRLRLWWSKLTTVGRHGLVIVWEKVLHFIKTYNDCSKLWLLTELAKTIKSCY